MKIFLIASMMLGGSSAVALTNEEVREDVRGFIEEKVNDRMHARHEERLEKLREEGIGYPEGEKFLELTEEQQTAVYTLIDEYNANNDFSVMTDEEIKEVMDLFKADLEALALELGFELPAPDKDQIRGHIRENVKDHMKERFEERRAEYIEDIKLNGFTLPNQERLFEFLTEEQQTAVLAQVEEVNTTYDFSTMTDEEIDEALVTIKEDFRLLFDELGIEKPVSDNDSFRHGYQEGFKEGYRQGRRHGGHHNQPPVDDELPPIDEDTPPVDEDLV